MHFRLAPDTARTISRSVVFLWLLFLIAFPINSTVADTNGDFNEIVNPHGKYFEGFTLKEGEAIYTRFHIINGPGIYFFIVDQDGHEEIMAGREASTRYEENTYEAEGGQWYYVGFEAPHESTWYVWWSKLWRAPYWSSAATIEGHVRKDTDSPSIRSFDVPTTSVSGTVSIGYEVHDLGFPISRIDLVANGSTVISNDNPDNNHYTTGFQVIGEFQWDSTKTENGRYLLRIRAWDALGHQEISESKTISINNRFWDYPMNRLLIIALAAIGVGCIFFSTKR